MLLYFRAQDGRYHGCGHFIFSKYVSLTTVCFAALRCGMALTYSWEGNLMGTRLRGTILTASSLLLVAGAWAAAESPEADAIAEVRDNCTCLTTAFNAGKVDEVVAIFLPEGELLDEDGTVHQGHAEIKGLLTAFFEKFPGAKVSAEVESVRMVGPVAIEDGNRTITAEDGVVKSQFRYIAVWAKSEKGWKLASLRDVADDPAPTPHEHLKPLAWIVGEWVNEGADGKVAIDYCWSDDKNFLLGTFECNTSGDTPRRTVQRIGWDPAAGRIRSWLFDADGGFSEGLWTVVDDGVVIKSSSVNPDGSTASATLTLACAETDRFTISGTDRIIGEDREEDFELNVVRRPPATSFKSK